MLISRMNRLIFWCLGWGVFSASNTKLAEELEAVFQRIREIRGIRFPQTPLNDEDYEINKLFFRELNRLLVKFVSHDRLGSEYDKRRARHFAEIALGFEKAVSE